MQKITIIGRSNQQKINRFLPKFCTGNEYMEKLENFAQIKKKKLNKRNHRFATSIKLHSKLRKLIFFVFFI